MNSNFKLDELKTERNEPNLPTFLIKLSLELGIVNSNASESNHGMLKVTRDLLDESISGETME